MANNPYVNKVVYGGTTLIDISDTTATAAQILEGYTAYGANGQKLTGTASGQSLVISDTIDSHGGTIRTITGKVVQLQTKTITPTSSQQIVNPDTGYDGFSQITVEAGGSTINNQNKSVTPTTSQQTVTADSGYTGLGTVTVNAMPSGTAGTPTASKGTVSNHSISVTPSVTNTTGYITGSTKTGTAVTVTASELASGNKEITTNGTGIDVVGYSTVSVNIAGAEYTRTVVCPQQTVTPDSSRQYALTGSGGFVEDDFYIITFDGTEYASSCTVLWTSNYCIGDIDQFFGSKGDVVVPVGIIYESGNYTIACQDTNQHTVKVEHLEFVTSGTTLTTKTITQNGTYNASSDSADGYSSVTVNVSGGGAGLTIATSTKTLSTSAASISFTGLSGDPTSFAVVSSADLATGASPYKTAAVIFDGSDLHGQTITNTSNAQVSYDDTNFTKSYSNGTLTITGSTYFQANQYTLVYTYGGGAIDTKDVQVGSGATSITFTGLEEEPEYFSCIFKSNFATSSGYQRVIVVVYDGTDTYGMAMDSSAKYSDQHWSYSYSNGSLTISSMGTNTGGYFHQPGYYQLTYAYDDGSGGNYQSKTVTPTTSQQVITADTGYDALKKVTVNAMPTMTLPTAASATSSGTSKATITPTSSVQYLNIPTGYNSTEQYYTIAAASGGGSASIDTKTLTTSGRPTSISFTSMKGQPKMFTLRCTSGMTRSSNSSYYYVAHVRYDGTNTTGNCWRMSNGNWTNITSGYSFTYSNSTLTISSSGTTTTSPGAFYNNGNYELVYVY